MSTVRARSRIGFQSVIFRRAFHMTTPLPTGESCVQAITNALASAKVRPELIDYINGHAISAQLNDANECFCIKQVFGEHARRLMISGMFGNESCPKNYIQYKSLEARSH